MPCSRQVTIKLWMIPTCLAPSSVQQNSQDLRLCEASHKRNYAQCPIMRSPRRSLARRRQPAYSQRHRCRSRLHITVQVCCPVTLNDRTAYEPLQHASSPGSDPIAAQRLACRMRGTLLKVARRTRLCRQHVARVHPLPHALRQVGDRTRAHVRHAVLRDYRSFYRRTPSVL